ncbi:MAG: DUF2752 domain-containing protein [Desulfomonile tiedjei]|uniref:DUF2752 domain-containing protein n=1 Tax=Desulfomonile tiedjei TaxID=2358 RepID=A0A9D6V3B4_9BACT|nr:DUF2752 domain-containing protein [Desulfomonile tiedjei]
MPVPPETRENRAEHLWLLAISAAVLVASAWLQFGKDSCLMFPVPLTENQIALMDTCLSRRVLGISCPGCGLTRSFVAMAHGETRAAFRYNPMGPILFVVCCFQIPYRLAAYFGNARMKGIEDRVGIVTWLIVGGLLIFWAFGFAQDTIIQWRGIEFP